MDHKSLLNVLHQRSDRHDRHGNEVLDCDSDSINYHHESTAKSARLC